MFGGHPAARKLTFCKGNEAHNLPARQKLDRHSGRHAMSEKTLLQMYEMLTARELETLLKIDRKTIYGYVQQGLMPYVCIQSNVRFRRTEINDWIEDKSYRPRPVNGAKKRLQ
jgi:excisionase family DNA binding protein